MSEITSRTFARHLDIDDVTYRQRNVIKARDARRTKPTLAAGILFFANFKRTICQIDISSYIPEYYTQYTCWTS